MGSHTYFLLLQSFAAPAFVRILQIISVLSDILHNDPIFFWTEITHLNMILQKKKKKKYNKRVLIWPLADVADDGYVGEKVVVLRGRHRFPQRFTALEVTYQDAKAV